MRRVERGRKEPASLSRMGTKGQTELERVRAHMADPKLRTRAFTFKRYKGEDVKLLLEKLFHGKCAYCETFYGSGSPVDVEHFRPKGAVEGDPTHPGYWWIAMRWDNLLPSCIDCNRRRKQQTPVVSDSLLDLHEAAGLPARGQSGKEASFPIAGTRAQPEVDDFSGERALLLDPCRDDPDEHLEFVLDGPYALVIPKATGEGSHGRSVRGAMSIQVYGLNRLRLVQDRNRVLRKLEFLGTLITDVGRMADEIEEPLTRCLGPAKAAPVVKRLRQLMDRVLEEMRALAAPDAPYSAMAAAWIKRFAASMD